MSVTITKGHMKTIIAFLTVALLSSSVFAASSQGEMISIVEQKLGVLLGDFNKKSVSSNYEDCTITVSKSKWDNGLSVGIAKKTKTPDGELTSSAGFSSRSYHTCAIERAGDTLTFNCTGEECETQGCTSDTQKMSITRLKFSIGKVSCNLEKK